jgi:hypothetical protein
MAGTAVCGRLTWQVATVTPVIRETDSVVTIGLEVPGWPGHRAGQHLDVLCVPRISSVGVTSRVALPAARP